jgi:hypothetical protein
MTPNLSDKPLRELLDYTKLSYADKRSILALYKSDIKEAQQQLLTELMEHKKTIGHGEFCTHCGGDFKVEAVPTSVIEQYQSNLKGKV